VKTHSLGQISHSLYEVGGEDRRHAQRRDPLVGGQVSWLSLQEAPWTPRKILQPGTADTVAGARLLTFWRLTSIRCSVSWPSALPST
jgi:hypothetical protein